MFTGIIKTIGKIISIEDIDTDIQLTIEYDGKFNIELGDSTVSYTHPTLPTTPYV